MPFVEMMVTMMHMMNQVMGNKQSFSGFNQLPYSPAFMPTMSALSQYGNLGQLPMSPAGMNALPLTQSIANPLLHGFETGSNAQQLSQHNDDQFWDLDNQGLHNSNMSNLQKNNLLKNGSMNGIWQTLSGEVMAVYNNNNFMWTNGMARNIAGKLIIQGNYLMAYVPAKKVTLTFQFYKEQNQFVVRDRKGRIYSFKRIY